MYIYVNVHMQLLLPSVKGANIKVLKLSLVPFIVSLICLKVFCHSAIFLAEDSVQHRVSHLSQGGGALFRCSA